jgi:hypothetical protein
MHDSALIVDRAGRAIRLGVLGGHAAVVSCVGSCPGAGPASAGGSR